MQPKAKSINGPSLPLSRVSEGLGEYLRCLRGLKGDEEESALPARGVKLASDPSNIFWCWDSNARMQIYFCVNFLLGKLGNVRSRFVAKKNPVLTLNFLMLMAQHSSF